MADVAIHQRQASHDALAQQQARRARLLLFDRVFGLMTLAAAVAVLVILGGVLALLLRGAWPALSTFGFGFLTSSPWNPPDDVYGAAAPIYGTLVTTVIAMAVAVPVGLGIAVFLTELCPYALRRPVGIAIELLAGIPSIIYGSWGLFVLAPFLQGTVEPGLIALFGPVPGLRDVFAGPPYGIGMLTAGFILGIMVLPFVASISRNVFETVPPVLKEAG